MRLGVFKTVFWVFWVGVLSSACAVLPRDGGPYGPGHREVGVASWYGPGFHGRRTSNGEVYDMHKMTAAHRKMPFGTHVRVRNLDNGRTVRVKINDRGPFVKGRILDLSYGAAKRLDMVGTGTARVEIKVIRPGEGPPAPDIGEGYYTIQVGAFKDRNRAVRLKRALRGQYRKVYLEVLDGGETRLYRIRIGRFRDEEVARRLASRIKSRENLDPVVLRTE